MIDEFFPLSSDRYQIRPGLSALHGPTFHVGGQSERYRGNKLAARAERLGKYFQLNRFDPPVRRCVQSLLIDRLASEHSDAFTIERFGDEQLLICHQTGDRLRFDGAGNFLEANADYTDGFDALAMQIEDDLVVMRRDADTNWASAIHLCSPNHWSAEQNIGRPFNLIHQPVADIEPINRNAAHWIDVMIRATGGLERIAWGIATDVQLNRHPEGSASQTKPRQFDPADPRAFLRIERQVMIGFPRVEALLFTIHTTFLDCQAIRNRPLERDRLVRNIETMSPATVQYKGLERYRDSLLQWLQSSTV